MKRAVIMGNGPSLNKMPPGAIHTMTTFGANYCKFQPDIYVCVDHMLLTKFHTKIYPLAKQAKTVYLAQKELGSSNLYDLPNVELVTHDREAFQLERYFTGLTVVYVALKIAYYLGFEEIHLWGVDHNKEWDHYKDDYPRGDIDRREWRMAEMEYHYQLAANVYNKAGRRIVNHSRPSKLDAIFPRAGKE